MCGLQCDKKATTAACTIARPLHITACRCTAKLVGPKVPKLRNQETGALAKVVFAEVVITCASGNDMPHVSMKSKDRLAQ